MNREIITTTSSQNSFYFYFLCVISGALLTLSFAPFGWDFVAIIIPAVLLFFLFEASPTKSFFLGYLFGLGFFGTGVSWVFISIHRYGNTSAPLAALITFLFVATLSFFPAIKTYIYNRFFPGPRIVKHLLVFPTLWVLVEWFRSWVFGGFPWLLLGDSQIYSPIAGFIPIMGTYGSTFLLVFTSGVISLIIFRQIRWQFMILLTILTASIWISGHLLKRIEWTIPNSPPIPVTLIQADIPQDMKWLPTEIQRIFNIYWTLTNQNWRAGIIVWPENAIPIPEQLITDQLDKISQQAHMRNATLISGIPIQAKDPQQYYNAMITLGNYTGAYYKRHLVPFGEYLPFAGLLRGTINFFAIPMSDFMNGSPYQPLLYAQGIPFAAFICYEIAYSHLVLSDLPKAQLLITISDDSWFGRSIAAAQHLQIAQIRSLESGRMQLFATNSGPSAIIDTKGRIVNMSKSFDRDVLYSHVQAYIGATPWVKTGNTVILVFFIALLYLTFLLTRKRNGP